MRKIININRNWTFTKETTESPAAIDSTWESVNLPHSWNAIDGQDGGNDYYRGTAVYAKSFDKLDLPTADRYYLEINGANSSADAYLNGKHLAHHDGGYSTWRVEITSALADSNLLVVAVDNAANETVYEAYLGLEEPGIGGGEGGGSGEPITKMDLRCAQRAIDLVAHNALERFQAARSKALVESNRTFGRSGSAEHHFLQHEGAVGIHFLYRAQHLCQAGAVVVES